MRQVFREVLVSAVLGLSVNAAFGQNATWLLSPGSSDFNTGANWSTATVPTSTAIFGASNTTSLTFSAADTVIGSMQFNAGAPAYSFAVSSALEFNGAGIVNNSANAPIINNSGGGHTFFENASTAGNAIITTNGAGSAVEFANASMAGSASITNSTGGGAFFVNTSTAGNAAIVNNGSGSLTEFSDTSTAGSASITNSTGGGAFFVNTSTAGNAAIVNNGSGSLTDFRDTSTAASATITNSNGGATFFQDNSSAGNARIITNSGSALEFNDSSTAANAIVITNAGGITAFQSTASGGQAQFITNAGGSFDISGLSSGGIGVGSIAGSGNYALGSKQLTVGSNNLSTVVSGQITDGGVFGGTGGSLVKVGTGTLTLSGNNSYTGATTINGGTLDVANSIAASSLTSVNAGGTLTGVGTVGSAQVNSGGIFAPGSGAGTSMTIVGNLGFESGAIYLIQLRSTSASFAAITGTASLGGIVLANVVSGGSVTKQYDILHAAGGLGGTTFSGAGFGNSNFSGSLSYTPTDVLLNLTAELGTGGSLNQNQQNVATAINNAFNSSGTLPANFANIFGLTGINLANALTQLDGEVGTGVERAAFQLTNQFLTLMLDPFVSGRGGATGGAGGGSAIGFAPVEPTSLPPEIALAYASILNKASLVPSFDQRWTAWGSAYGGSNTTNGNAVVGSTNTTTSTYGFAGGMDYHVSPSTVVGFALAGAGTNWGLANALGTGRSDAVQVGGYGISWLGPAYVAGALSFSNHWFTTDRSALGDALTANFTGQSYGARFESGYRYAVLPAFGVTPYGAVQAQTFHTPAYSESDTTGGGFGLSYASMNASDVRTELGARFDDPTLLYGKPLILFGRAAWAHDFVGNPALSAAFQALTAGTFTVNGAPIPHDSALASAGAELFITPRWTLLAKFDGEFANGSQTYAGTGTLRYVW
jgi:autotransporter-associated beta strand protein